MKNVEIFWVYVGYSYCAKVDEREAFQTASLKEIDTIHIYRSRELMDKGKQKITISVKSDITRLIKSGGCPNWKLEFPLTP
ncbi:hypothetical protein [Peribacillus sp. NPDC096540]|uniref:hypothetical protein n=1 Tax=Peribacillus sp. NPDC096540 TaxID=3390612 RepID=UPI003CFF6195